MPPRPDIRLRRPPVGGHEPCRAPSPSKLVVPSGNAWAHPRCGRARTSSASSRWPSSRRRFRRLGEPAIGAALVIGVGSQGLLATLSLVARGTAVLVYDVNADRVDLAIRARRARAGPRGRGRVRRPRRGHGGHAGRGRAWRCAMSAIGGTLLVLGLDATPFELTAQTLVRRQLVIRGSLTYDHPGDFAPRSPASGRARSSPGPGHHRRVPPRRGTPRAFERSGSARGKTWIRVARSAPA